MRSKTFFTIACIFCVLLAVVVLIHIQDKPSGQKMQLGKKLFDTLSDGGIVSIQIVGPAGRVDLKNEDERWVVANRYRYPADFSKISDLVKKLRAAKIGRSFGASDKVIARLGMQAPDPKDEAAGRKGTRVTLSDARAKALADVIIGRPNEDTAQGGTAYVKPVSEKTVYLIDQEFKFLDEKPGEWIDKTLLDLDAKDIARVVCRRPPTGAVVYTIERPARDKDAELKNAPSGKKIAKYRITQMIDMMAPFKIEDVADPARRPLETSFADSCRFEYHLFDGTRIEMLPGAAVEKGSDNHFLRIRIHDIPAESKLNQALKKRKIETWTYVVSKWVYNSFYSDPADFIEKEEKK